MPRTRVPPDAAERREALREAGRARDALAWALFVEFVRANPDIPADADYLPAVWRAYRRH